VEVAGLRWKSRPAHLVAALRGGLICETGEDCLNDAVASHSDEGKGFFGFDSDSLEEPIADHSMAAMKTDFDVLLCEVESMGCFEVLRSSISRSITTVRYCSGLESL
jgi:hypothetical protein